ncbi:MAG: PAS domain S-box protein [Candidatus Bathyarchaeota archaeon]|nr:PAS domain S-box protein [Candidatus Bathyarchaeota archaeon]
MLENHKPSAEQKTALELGVFFQHSSDLLVVVGFNGIFKSVNPYFEKSLGWKAQEVKGKYWSAFVHPEDIQRVNKEGWSFIKGKSLDHYKSRFQCKDGSYKVISWKQTGLVKENSILCIGRDITDVIKIEEELKEKEEKLLQVQEQMTAILENIDNGFISLDKEWKFNYLNSRAAHNGGFEPYQLIGKNIWETFPKFVGTKVEQNYRKVMDWNVSITFEVKDALTNRRYEEKVYPTTSGIAIFWTDITQRKSAEDELRKTRNYLENLLNCANAPIIVWNSNLKITLFNRAFEFMTGFKASEVLGKPLDSLFPVDEKEKARNQIERAIKGESLESVEIPILRRDGTKRLALWNSANIYDQKKKIVATIAQGQDITQRKKAEDELRKKTGEVEKYATHMEALAAERLKQLKDAERLAAIGQTAGMVGHDLRNPLQSIVGEVYLAKTEIETLPECQQKLCLKENLDAIADQIDYMDKIVSDLQTFVKPVELHKKLINLNQFVEAVFAQVSIPRNVNVNIDLGSETLTLETDPQLLKRVLINLVTNAFQAMPEGGELTLKAHKTNEKQIKIIVQDSGIGVPDDIKPKLFTPLFTTKSKGQGFGLAVCKRVIEAQGGAITFESQFGKGTKFTINYPIT